MFTVFTPTFNRAHTLPRVYESLKAQTYRNFEWVIVDDGSTDNTYELVKKWQEGPTDFPIRYYWQQNKGKHIGFNRGVQEARGEFFLPLDSDDSCVPEALERFKFHWDSIPPTKKKFFSGVCGLCQDQNGKLIGDPFPFNITESDSLEIYYRYKVRGEKWGFHRTKILSRYTFPEIEKAKFIPEGVVWNAIAKDYKVRFVNEILRIYWIEDSYSTNQLTRSLRGAAWNHAIGCSFYYGSCLNEDIVWFRYAPLEFFRFAVHYFRFSLHSGVSLTQSLQKVRPVIAKVLVILAIPIGVFLYRFEKMKINLITKYKWVVKTKIH